MGAPREIRWSWASKDNNLRTGYLSVDGRVSITDLVRLMGEVAPGVNLSDIDVNWGTVVWHRPATEEELAQRAEQLSRAAARHDAWELKTYEMLREEYGSADESKADPRPHANESKDTPMGLPPADVALWYLRDGHPDLDLCDDETDAAETAALYLSGDTDHAYRILGLQYPDGRTVPAADWDISDALTAYAANTAARRALPTPPQHLTRDPFTGGEIWIHDSDPAWLGNGETLRSSHDQNS